MMWWDRIAGTYKYPETVRTFNRSKERFVLGGSDYKVEERVAEPVPVPPPAAAAEQHAKEHSE